MTDEQKQAQAIAKPSDQSPRQLSNHPPSRRSGQLSGLQIMFAAILAIGLILAINFSTRISSTRLQREIYATVESEVESLKLERATLVAERDYVQSDVYVEQWARSDGKMVRPGMVLVIPLPLASALIDPTPTPAFVVDVQTTHPEPDNWTLWWALFFDSPPPGR